MTVYIIFLVLNLLGMGYLFYSREKQMQVNTEFLKNAVIINAVVEVQRQEIEELTILSGKLKEELKELKEKIEKV